MIDETEIELKNGLLLRLLEELGLTKLESKVYLAILKKRTCKSSEILEELKIHQPQLYDVVLSLQKKGLVVIQPGKPKYYSAIDPLTIIEKKISQLSELKSHVKKLIEELEFRQEISTPHIWVIKGRQNIIAHAKRLIQLAQVEIQILVDHFMFARLADELIQSKLRGVHICLIIYPEEYDMSINGFLERIGTVKVSPAGQFCLIVDSKTGMYGPGKLLTSYREVQDEYSILFDEVITAETLANYFYHLWSSLKYLFPMFIDVKEFPKRFVNHRSAVSEIIKLTNAGYRVTVEVKGRWTRSGRFFLDRGDVISTESNPLCVAFAIQLKNGKIVKIGGRGSKLHDVEADQMTIHIRNK
ncbi:MAG: TrmB family transcriptional regulator [Sulfolobales archaeon]